MVNAGKTGHYTGCGLSLESRLQRSTYWQVRTKSTHFCLVTGPSRSTGIGQHTLISLVAACPSPFSETDSRAFSCGLRRLQGWRTQMTQMPCKLCWRMPGRGAGSLDTQAKGPVFKSGTPSVFPWYPFKQPQGSRKKDSGFQPEYEGTCWIA